VATLKNIGMFHRPFVVFVMSCLYVYIGRRYFESHFIHPSILIHISFGDFRLSSDINWDERRSSSRLLRKRLVESRTVELENCCPIVLLTSPADPFGILEEFYLWKQLSDQLDCPVRVQQ